MKTDHLDYKRIIEYLAGTLSKTAQAKVEQHNMECTACNLKTTFLMHKGGTKGIDKLYKEAYDGLIDKADCKGVQAKFELFYKGRLKRDEKDFVRKHIGFCTGCGKQYDRFLDKQEHPGIIELVLGYLKKIPYLGIEQMQPAPLRASSRIEPPQLENMEELSKSGVTATVTTDSKDNIKVYLASNKYDVSAVAVSIDIKTKDGLTPLASAITSKRGIANLGKRTLLEKEEGKASKKRRYALQIAELREKL